MKTLIRIRLKAFFRALYASFGKRGRGLAIVLICLLVYAAACFLFLFGMMGFSLLPLCSAGNSWLYFAIAGTVAFALALFGTVFTTQNQLYVAKDNALLLSMPIKPRDVLVSRLVVLLLGALGMTALVFLPFSVVYGIVNGVTLSLVVGTLFGLVGTALLAQCFSCLLGWLLHLCLRHVRNKAIASALFSVAFLVLYFTIYGNAQKILNVLLTDSAQFASFYKGAGFLFYLLGKSVTEPLWTLAFLAVVGVFCALVFRFLTATMRRAMTGEGPVSKPGKKQKADYAVRGAATAVCKKEKKRFLSSAVYLTNAGLGILMFPALTVAGILFRTKLEAQFLPLLGEDYLHSLLPALLVGVCALLNSMVMVSAPSVSLEGKSLWILRSMPVDGRTVLRGKLRMHLLASMPIALVSMAVLGIAYGCDPLGLILALISVALLMLFGGVLGLCLNLLFPRFDWPNEAYPCKQSLSVFLYMLIGWLIAAASVILFIVGSFLSVTLFLFVYMLAFAVIDGLLLWLLFTVGARKFEKLSA